MANNLILNVSEQNFATEVLVGQANDSAKEVTQIHPVYGTLFTKSVAIEAGKLVGIKSDGKAYLASAGAGAGQLAAVGMNWRESCKGEAIDLISQSRTIELPYSPTSSAAGKLAYLDPVNPGEIVAVAPSTEGQLVQIVGVFVAANRVKLDIQLVTSTVPAE
jgi:hypothetical protein